MRDIYREKGGGGKREKRVEERKQEKKELHQQNSDQITNLVYSVNQSTCEFN